MSDLDDWNAGLEELEPLIDYYARQMGQLSGRLMAALSVLTDLEDAQIWREQPAEVTEPVHQARLLVASVLKVVMASQEVGEHGDEELDAAEAIRAAMNHLANNGGTKK